MAMFLFLFGLSTFGLFALGGIAWSIYETYKDYGLRTAMIIGLFTVGFLSFLVGGVWLAATK